MSPNMLISPSSPLPIKQPDTSIVSKAKENFGELLGQTISDVNQKQIDGDMATTKLQTGEAKHLHEVMISMEQADISLRMLVQMRNKALAAYEEIMRMQV